MLLLILCFFERGLNHATRAACEQPWLMPTADTCERFKNTEWYFFNNRTACIDAPGRDVYCDPPTNQTFCALRDSGNFTGRWQVECG